MRQRCSDPRHRAFKDYGARGIEVCERWRDDFWAFFEDLGERPSPNHSLDRRDNNKGYDAANCRWATAVEQMNNTRTNVLLATQEGALTIAQAGRAGLISPTAERTRRTFRKFAAESEIGDRAVGHRRPVFVEVDGKQLALPELCRRHNADYDAVYLRLRCGWSLERAISTPVRSKRRNLATCRTVSYHGFDVVLVDLCRDKNVPLGRVEGRLQKGWTVEQAIDVPPLRPLRNKVR